MRCTILLLAIHIGALVCAEAGDKVRRKRSMLALPANSSISIKLDLSVPITALTGSRAFYNMRLPFDFFIPTVDQLLAPSGRESSEENDIYDRDHHEQQRKHEERRYIYKSMESFLSR